MTALVRSANALWNSSIGKKIIVAATGLFFIAFLAAHLSGNLLLFVGREAFNDYAKFLHHMGHGSVIWIARVTLLVAIALHIVATVQLTRANRTARKAYEHEGTLRATRSSKIMIWSGLTILAFIIYHILHFTVRTNPQLAKLGSKDPWQMVITGFQSPLVVIFYLIAMTLLCSHLSHGFASAFQTLGLRSKKTQDVLNKAGKAYSLLIWIGFISIPVSIFIFGFGS